MESRECKQAFYCGNVFSKNSWTQEFIFAEKGPFEISKNKNPSKITHYMVAVPQHAHLDLYIPNHCYQ